MVVDLKHPSGTQVVERLLDTADVLVESFRPGVMERLGLGHEKILAARPSLVYASLSGYGSAGPMADAAGHDVNYLALSGLLDRLGHSATPPAVPPIPFADLIGGGLLPALGITALIARVRAGGAGGWLDASAAESIALLPNLVVADILAGATVPGRGRTEFGGGSPDYRVYELADGHVAVGAVEEPFWQQLCEAIGRPDIVSWRGDPARSGALEETLSHAFVGMTRAEVEQRFVGRDACVTVVRSYEEMLAAEDASARGYTRVETGVPMPVLSPPFVLDGERPPVDGAAPRQGADTTEVLQESGFTEGEIQDLVDEGVVGLG